MNRKSKQLLDLAKTMKKTYAKWDILILPYYTFLSHHLMMVSMYFFMTSKLSRTCLNYPDDPISLNYFLAVGKTSVKTKPVSILEKL